MQGALPRKVQFVELTIFEDLYPLVPGLLTAYAQTDAVLARHYSFDRTSFTMGTDTDDGIALVLAEHADIYALSCYVWNMRFMRKLVKAIRSNQPQATIILGGPQIMNAGRDYFPDPEDNIIICNGEGEVTFAAILRALADHTPLAEVPGVSFFQGAEFVATPPAARLRTLDDIPSPYLQGLFPGAYRYAILETNRGCPFRCSFCFWGAATNDKVSKFDETRIRDELTTISQNRIGQLYIADANWGMLKRDVELTRHIIECRKAHGAPLSVAFSSSKNSAERVSEITTEFSQAGMINTQTVSLQSLNQPTLQAVERENLKLDAYLRLQKELNEDGVGSYIELIWPLPGETLQTFVSGFVELRRKGAKTIVAYPNLLLRNTPMTKDRDALGIKTLKCDQGHSEEELVIATKDADAQDVALGDGCIQVMQALINAQCGLTLLDMLAKTGAMRAEDFILDFARFLRAQDSNPIAAHVRDGIDGRKHGIYGFTTTFYEMVLHRHRALFTALLRDFCARHDWWRNPIIQGAFEFDIFRKPYLFNDTMPEFYEYDFQVLEFSPDPASLHNVTITLPDEHDLLANMIAGLSGFVTDPATRAFQITHDPGKAARSSQWAEADLMAHINGRTTSIINAEARIMSADFVTC